MNQGMPSALQPLHNATRNSIHDNKVQPQIQIVNKDLTLSSSTTDKEWIPVIKHKRVNSSKVGTTGILLFIHPQAYRTLSQRGCIEGVQLSEFFPLEEKQANRLDHMPPNKVCFVQKNVESIGTSYRCNPISHKETFLFECYLK
ncbi:hypothetical protein WA026_020876 [Henosepilachna vigintioctopunctata]|uniref:Uncharacterized protein n=1 Tax=Henosepilachna vigintioctopunctata TaxID=420089 RepID=A0AAW1UPC4_9CUCU